jgi:ABC-2 type transport system permease protein
LRKAVADFIKYFDFLKQIVLRDLKKKYYKSVLGVLWTILNPLFMTIIITLVFSHLFKRSIDHYPIYYLCGTLLFSFNSGSTRQALHTMIANNGFLRKIYVPKYMFCLSNISVNFVDLFFSLIVLLGAMLVTGVPFTWKLLYIPVPVCLTLLFTIGLSLVLTTYGVFFRDLNHLYGIFVTAWTYLTPLFYPITAIPEQFRVLYNLNPMYIYITIMRTLVLDAEWPSVYMLLLGTLYSVVMLAVGIWVFRKNQDKFFLYI